jgi:hypothetical protein
MTANPIPERWLPKYLETTSPEGAYRANYRTTVPMLIEELASLSQIIRELLAMEELDLGDHSQLPEDHPIARAEKAIGNR